MTGEGGKRRKGKEEKRGECRSGRERDVMPRQELRDLEQLEPGDHLCCLYGGEEERRSLTASFLLRGLEQGQKSIHIADAGAAPTVEAYLRGKGIDPNPYLERGQLVLLTSAEAYTKGGTFDPDRMIGFLRAETERALAEGYAALRVSGEMTWALGGLPGSRRLMEYEAGLDRFLPGSACLALCLYDRMAFGAGLLLEVVAAHPLVVVGDRLYENFYYLPPEKCLSEDPAEAKLEQWLRNLAVERSLRESLLWERRFSSELIDSLPVFFVAIDPQGRTLTMNEMMLKELGYTKEEVMGEDYLRRFVPPEDRAGLQRVFDTLVKSGRTTVSVNRVRAKDGREIVVEWHGKPVFSEGGELDYFYGLGLDITERVRSEETMRRINEELEAYAHAVSHDLRAPIANITAAAETLRRLLAVSGATKDERFEEVITHIIASSRQATDLIEETLRVSRERALAPEVGEVDLSGIVAEVVREREETLRLKGVRVDADEDLGRFPAHRVDMYRIFSNLLDNAVRFAPPGEGVVEVRKLAMEEEGALRFLVRDNGPGIDPDLLEDVFTLFSRGKGGMTGVGLATVKLLVEAYGGDIRAYNDGGACFEFTLRPQR